MSEALKFSQEWDKSYNHTVGLQVSFDDAIMHSNTASTVGYSNTAPAAFDPSASFPKKRKATNHKQDVGTDFSWLNNSFASSDSFILPVDFRKQDAGITERRNEQEEEKNSGTHELLSFPNSDNTRSAQAMDTRSAQIPVEGDGLQDITAQPNGYEPSSPRMLTLLAEDGRKSKKVMLSPEPAETACELPRTASGVIKARPMEHLTSYAMVKSVLDYCLSKGQYRDYCCWMIGLSTGLRICDIVKLRLTDLFTDTITLLPDNFSLRDEKRKANRLATSYEHHTLRYRDAIDIVEQKTKKHTVSNVDAMIITESIRTGVNTYLKSKGFVISPDGMEVIVPTGARYDGYLLTHLHDYGDRPLTTETQYEMVKAMRKPLNLPHVGTHSMRKTFLNIANTIACTGSFNGNTNALTDVQILAHHSKPETTLRYMNAIKPRVVSLRKAVSDFLMGKTKVKELNIEYNWELEEEDE